MEMSMPIRKIFILAVISSVVFGIFSAVPPFELDGMVPGRTLTLFCLLTALSLLFWLFNFQLLQWFLKKRESNINNILRYILSISFTSFVAYLIHKYFAEMIPPPSGRPVLFIRGEPPMPGQMMFGNGIGTNGPGKAIHIGGPRFIFSLVQSQAMNLITLILLELTVLKDRKSFIELENASLRLANAESKNLLLRRQLNPHFLFNSLSTLRSLIKRDGNKAEEYLEKLADLLRLSTQNASLTVISLTEEILLCKYYLEMQKVRFGEALLYKIDIPRTLTENGLVPVNSLQLLIENAIKHNALTKEKTPIHLR